MWFVAGRWVVGGVLAEGRWYLGVAVLLRRRCWSSHCGGMKIGLEARTAAATPTLLRHTSARLRPRISRCRCWCRDDSIGKKSRPETLNAGCKLNCRRPTSNAHRQHIPILS